MAQSRTENAREWSLMAGLKIERIVEFPDENSEALRRTYEFMTNRGYRYAAQLTPPKFRRGNLLGHLTALTPKSWRTTVIITIPEKETATAHCIFEVDTTGQIVTVLEKDFWEAEADELTAVLRKEIAPNKSARLAGAALKQNLAVLGLATLAAGAAMFFYPAVTLTTAAGVGGVAFLLVFSAGHVWLLRQARGD